MKDFFTGLLMADLGPAERTAVWRVAITVLVVGHVSWACGWLPGMSGFAMADEQHSLAATLLEKDIIEAQERFCRAQVTGNVEAQRYAEERRRKLLHQWLELKGSAFDLPSCEELGISE